MDELNPFQQKLLERLERSLNRCSSVTDLAYRMKSSRPAITSSSRALERLGYTILWRKGDDQWAVLMVALTQKARDALDARKPALETDQ